MNFSIIFAFIFALFAAVMATTQQPVAVGGDKCTWGPSYWCKSRANAEQCNAIQHCETKVWNKQ